MNLIIKAMLELQDKINTKTLGEGWRKSDDQDWHLAISQECAEGIDHIGWKWWAKQEPNLQAARIEVIDILHFVLSAELWWKDDDLPLEKLSDRLEQSFVDYLQPVYIDEHEFQPGGGSPVQLFQLISGLACVGRTNIGLVFLLAEKLGLNVLEVSVLYRQKATLNLFRQNNGYKEGTYTKHWGPSLEDNDFLATLSQGINWSHASAQDLFYGRLNVKYLEVTQALKTH